MDKLRKYSVLTVLLTSALFHTALLTVEGKLMPDIAMTCEDCHLMIRDLLT